MLEELAIVVKTEQQQIWVTGGQQSACGGCRQKSGCTTHAVSGMLKRKPVLVSSHLPLSIGDQVIVGIDENSLLRAALTLYLLPLIAMFAGAGIADTLMAADAYAEVWVAASALAGLLLSLACIKLAQTVWLFQHFPHPVVIKKVIAAAYECLGN